MNKKPNNIADLLRKIIEKEFSAKVYDELLKQLLEQLMGLTLFYLKRLNIDRDLQEIAKDTRNTAFKKIYESFIKKFWTETSEKTENNDKRINAYVYTIIKESYRENSEKLARKESHNLYQNVRKICNSLHKVGYINLIDKEYYSKCSKSDDLNYFSDYSFNRYYIDLKRGKDGQLNVKKLKEFILELFEDKDMENFCFTISDLTRIISENSNYGVYVEKRVNRFELLPEEGNEPTLILEALDNETDKILNHDVIKSWISNFRKAYDKEELTSQALMVVLFFKYYFTLDRIRAVINLNSNSEISSLQTIKNKIDNCVQNIGIQKFKEDPEIIKMHLNKFLEDLETEFVPVDFINSQKTKRDE